MASINTPDYEIADVVEVSTPAQLRAIADPLRMMLLDLVLERAATVTELAQAVGRPKSSIAHHVNVLHEAGLMRVVRTRKVRAIEERFYGRTGRTIHTSIRRRPGDTTMAVCVNALTIAATESEPAHETDELCTAIRHVRVPRAKAMEFWRRIEELMREFSELPRAGDTVHALVAGMYPASYPTLPPPPTSDRA